MIISLFSEMEAKIYSMVGNVNGLAFCGTFPPGVPPSFFADVALKKGLNL